MAFTAAGDRRAAGLRRQSLRDTLDRTLALVTDVGADVLLCGGDLYEHERFAADTGTFLQSAFERIAPVRVFLAPGNHDWYGPRSLYHTVDWSSNVHVFRTDSLKPVDLADGLTLWGAAHCAPANTPGFLEAFSVDRSGINIALFHGSERAWFTDEEANKTLHAPFDREQIARAGLCHAFLGHFHHPRDDELFTYPGNPNPLSFGEDGERGAVIVTVNGNGTIERQRQAVAVTEAHDLAVGLDGVRSEQDVRARIADAIRGLRGIARVTLSGDLPSEVDLRARELQSVESDLDALQVVVGEVHRSYDFAAIRQEPTVRGEFVGRALDDGDLSDDLRRRVLITGLRALAGRTDLEVE